MGGTCLCSSSKRNDGGATLGPHLRGPVGVQAHAVAALRAAVPPDGPAQRGVRSTFAETVLFAYRADRSPPPC